MAEAPIRLGDRYVPERTLGEHEAGRFVSAIDGVEGGRVTVFLPRLQGDLGPAKFMRLVEEELARCAPLADSLYCTLRDAGLSDQGEPFVVVRRPNGVSLRSLVQEDGRLDAERTLGVAIQICDLVRRAQALDICPAAIDPAWIIIDTGRDNPTARQWGGPRVAIVDLGLSRGVYGSRVAAAPANELITSPQLLTGQAPHPRDDVFAVTALVHLMVFGVAPPVMSPHGPADGSGWPTLPDDARLHRRVEPCLHTILLRGLAPERAHRFPHIAALQRALTGMRQLMSLSTAAFELLAATRSRMGRGGDPLGMPAPAREALQRAARARARIREVVAMGDRGAASLRSLSRRGRDEDR